MKSDILQEQSLFSEENNEVIMDVPSKRQDVKTSKKKATQRQVTVYIDEKLHTRARCFCVQHHITFSAFVVELIRAKLNAK